jgi:ribonuclease VapC
MIFVETSAVVEIMKNGPRAADVSDALAEAGRAFTAPHVRLEACMVLSTEFKRRPTEVQAFVDEFLAENNIDVVAFTDDMARAAVAAFESYGKRRRNAAQLNLADCMSYAAAKSLSVAMLFIGADFTQTDTPSVLTDPSPGLSPS